MSSVNALPQYVSQGPGYPLTYTEAGAGQPLLLIHGSLCDYRYWRWQVPAFSQEYRVLAPSLRGYWPNVFDAERRDFHVEQHARDLIEFIRFHADRPVHILGHSRGAHVALELASMAPELVRSLILADPGFRINDEPSPHPFQLDVVDHLKNGDLEGAMALFIDTVNGAGTWRHMVGWFKTMVKDNARTLLSQINDDSCFDLKRAAPIHCPVLLVGGDQSPERYGHRLDTLERVFAQAQRVTIPLASHGMNLANPKAFNTNILQFLSSQCQAKYSGISAQGY